MLGEWRWNLFHDEGQLWAKILVSKYRGWRGLEENGGDSFESLWWRDLKSIFQTTQQGEDVIKGVKWRVWFYFTWIGSLVICEEPLTLSVGVLE